MTIRMTEENEREDESEDEVVSIDNGFAWFAE